MAEQTEKWTGHDDRRATELSFTSAGGFRLAIRQSAMIGAARLPALTFGIRRHMTRQPDLAGQQ